MDEPIPAARTVPSEEVVVRAALARLVDENPSALDDLVHPDYRDHTLSVLARGPIAFRALGRQLRSAFADIELIPADVIVGTDRVAVRLRFRGLHVAPYAGLEPCGHTVAVDEIHIWRLEDGLLIEHWACRDDRAALSQIGGATFSWDGD